jgi:hypothetical protein
MVRRAWQSRVAQFMVSRKEKRETERARNKKYPSESLLPFPAWGTGNASLSFLPTVPLLINFTVTFTKKKKERKKYPSRELPQ